MASTLRASITTAGVSRLSRAASGRAFMAAILRIWSHHDIAQDNPCGTARQRSGDRNHPPEKVYQAVAEASAAARSEGRPDGRFAS
ncbi:hypothetical protein KL86PLE_40599 [uncultured Pleomorphomonas sp.]|uniref:Uncharacterized protein n=1 Tax=uncultured Pleomorphomonas sp. TaxID=442121 RepID=A0A212LGW4_9HYPH|nr:hypothetical protein KL86PLE_40599 [uncultured Pleomorphomonas sp.]